MKRREEEEEEEKGGERREDIGSDGVPGLNFSEIPPPSFGDSRFRFLVWILISPSLVSRIISLISWISTPIIEKHGLAATAGSAVAMIVISW